jgi:hypothetical protein
MYCPARPKSGDAPDLPLSPEDAVAFHNIQYGVARASISFRNELEPGFKEKCYTIPELNAMSEPGAVMEEPITHEKRVDVVRAARAELFALAVCACCDQLLVDVEQHTLEKKP